MLDSPNGVGIHADVGDPCGDVSVTRKGGHLTDATMQRHRRRDVAYAERLAGWLNAGLSNDAILDRWSEQDHYHRRPSAQWIYQVLVRAGYVVERTTVTVLGPDGRSKTIKTTRATKSDL